MKFCIIQPLFSTKIEDADICFNGMLSLLEQCDNSLDVIVMPEYCDVPVYAPDKKVFESMAEKYSPIIRQKVIETARRCNAIVFANFTCKAQNGYRNTTYAFDRSGNEVGKYFKAHPTAGETNPEWMGGRGMDTDYLFEPRSPYTVELEGIRFGFMTCYDFYFYENFAPLARRNVDVIIGCSHQRSDTQSALEIINRFLSYNTNAYLVRSSVSMGQDSGVGGGSTVVAPDGTVLADMKSQVGINIVEFDPHKKYYKPAGFGGKLKAHWQYIEDGRKPSLYSAGGSGIVAPDRHIKYPRVCAHRGFNTIAPENSLPAFAAAISLGAEEIEFDIWPTKDGEIVSLHDSTLERVSDGKGFVYDYTLEELQKFDFGIGYNGRFKGLKILTLEEILKQFACRVIMNIHVKYAQGKHPDDQVEKLIAQIRKYECAQHVYIMCDNNNMSLKIKELAPDICRNKGANWNKPHTIVDDAIALGCKKVQLAKARFNDNEMKELINKAHEYGIICNLFESDDEEETIKYLNMGIDCILSNDFLKISNTVKKYKQENGISYSGDIIAKNFKQ